MPNLFGLESLFLSLFCSSTSLLRDIYFWRAVISICNCLCNCLTNPIRFVIMWDNCKVKSWGPRKETFFIYIFLVKNPKLDRKTQKRFRFPKKLSHRGICTQTKNGCIGERKAGELIRKSLSGDNTKDTPLLTLSRYFRRGYPWCVKIFWGASPQTPQIPLKNRRLRRASEKRINKKWSKKCG